MLFPKYSKEDLRKILQDANFDLDKAITILLGQDNMANAQSDIKISQQDSHVQGCHFILT